jgi:hypothetical protein
VIRLVLHAADNDRNGHLWYVALSGLCRGEIAGLIGRRSTARGGTITIERSRVQAGADTMVENDPKTGIGGIG